MENALYKKFSKSVFDENGELTSFSVNCPKNFNFAYDVVDEMAKTTPNKIALVWVDVDGNKKTFSFSQMSELSSKTANFLSKNGIKKGDRVMVILKRHYEYWYTLLALHKVGAVAIPATYMLTTFDVVYRTQSANIKYIICAEDESLLESVLEAKAECPSLSLLFNVRTNKEGFFRIDTGIKAESNFFSRTETSSEDPFLLYFTSGTTGYPKPVIHDSSYPLAHIITAKYWHNLSSDSLHMTVADTGWAKASWGKFYGQWLCGSAVMVYDFERFDAEAFMKVMAENKVTSLCAPPTIFRFLVKNGLEKYDFSSLRYVTTAGEPLNTDIMEKFYTHTGLEIKEGYGQTETTLLLANLYGSKSKRGSLGKPSPLYSIKLIDEEGEDVEPGNNGEIVVLPTGRRNYGLCVSYDNDERARIRAWKNGVYHTGDIAYTDEDGFYYFVGRMDDIIKSSGYKISPFEVESVLIKHPAVLECAITGVPDSERGFIIKATIVLQKGYTPSDELKADIKDFVKSSTAPYKYPRIIQFVFELPKTISGKIKHDTIRKTDVAVYR